MPDRASLQLGPTLGTKNEEKMFILKLLRFLSEIKHVGGWWNLSPPISLELFVYVVIWVVQLYVDFPMKTILKYTLKPVSLWQS